MDDHRAALMLSGLALTGAGVRFVLAPRLAAPGDVHLVAGGHAAPLGVAGDRSRAPPRSPARSRRASESTSTAPM